MKEECHLPLVSVVMPVYNCDAFVGEAVNSVLNQTFQDFELIIIDDGSTDSTREVLNGFDDSRINLVFFDKNQGVSKATNEGFRLAKGTYIARMDGDDISVRERFEKQVDVLESNPDILICGSHVKYLGGTNNVIRFKENHNEIITELLVSCSICMGSSMFRRKALRGYYYDEARRSGEDYEFWTRVAWLGELYNIQEVLLLYRVHEKQASIKHKPQQVIDDVDIRLGLFKKLGYDSNHFDDVLLLKLFLLNKPIEVKEFVLFFKWLKELVLLNSIKKVYPQKEFKEVIKRIKRSLLFSLYFKNTTIGITKKWRLKALFKLPLQDMIYVLKGKRKEMGKRILKT
ncbi:glycosyltransferase family 2 protein [Flavisericum labens]|uniref:glycosyltransferase family 2 protein n=1 Tax=Flavisericum labens TaxID=3377112 RepID=UPI00387AE6D5